MTQQESVSISSIPAAFRWHNAPTSWKLTAENALTISAGQRTDWFIDPEGKLTVHNAPALLMRVQQPCMLKAHVIVDHKATYDAGVLTVYQSDQVWAKLCLELSPQGQVMIVSVVTKGVSDDCNSIPIAGHSVYLRIARLDRAYAFHYSHDGIGWNLVRYFTLGEAREAELGFLAQSPTGDGSSASFSEITYLAQKLNDVRSGE